VLAQQGAKVCATDKKTDVDWGYDPAAEGIELRLGEDPIGFVAEFELVIISPGISVYAPFVEKATELGIPVWGEAELAYRLCPCPMIAITGTNGKTTVTTLVGEILKQHNPKTQIAGNIGIPLTSLVTELDEDAAVVAEISSFQLETISAFRPQISAVLNMTEDHLDRHLTMENYIAAKSRIFENHRQNEITVLNYDNGITANMKPPGRVVFFSTEVQLESGVFLRDGKIIAILANNTEIQIPMLISETKVMPENALAAAAISLCAGVSPGIIADTLRNFPGVEHRLEFVASIGGVDFFNDSKATNTDAAMKALAAFDREIVLIAGGRDKDMDFAPWVKLFQGKVAKLILIGETAKKIASVCDNENYFSYTFANSMEEAVRLAKNSASAGQVVLLSPACASFDMFENFEQRGAIYKNSVGGDA